MRRSKDHWKIKKTMSIKFLMEYQIALVIKLSTVAYVINWVYRMMRNAATTWSLIAHLFGKIFSCVMPFAKYQFESFPLAFFFLAMRPKIYRGSLSMAVIVFAFRWIFQFISNFGLCGGILYIVKVIAYNFLLFFLIICFAFSSLVSFFTRKQIK